MKYLIITAILTIILSISCLELVTFEFVTYQDIFVTYNTIHGVK